MLKLPSRNQEIFGTGKACWNRETLIKVSLRHAKGEPPREEFYFFSNVLLKLHFR